MKVKEETRKNLIRKLNKFERLTIVESGAVVFLLQQGDVLKAENAELKAFRQMWKAFKSKRGNRSAFVLCSPSKGTIRDDMESFEQKYLKEAKSGKVKS